MHQESMYSVSRHLLSLCPEPSAEWSDLSIYSKGEAFTSTGETPV